MFIDLTKWFLLGGSVVLTWAAIGCLSKTSDIRTERECGTIRHECGLTGSVDRCLGVVEWSSIGRSASEECYAPITERLRVSSPELTLALARLCGADPGDQSVACRLLLERAPSDFEALAQDESFEVWRSATVLVARSPYASRANALVRAQWKQHARRWMTIELLSPFRYTDALIVGLVVNRDLAVDLVPDLIAELRSALDSRSCSARRTAVLLGLLGVSSAEEILVDAAFQRWSWLLTEVALVALGRLELLGPRGREAVNRLASEHWSPHIARLARNVLLQRDGEASRAVHAQFMRELETGGSLANTARYMFPEIRRFQTPDATTYRPETESWPLRWRGRTYLLTPGDSISRLNGVPASVAGVAGPRRCLPGTYGQALVMGPSTSVVLVGDSAKEGGDAYLVQRAATKPIVSLIAELPGPPRRAIVAGDWVLVATLYGDVAVGLDGRIELLTRASVE